MGCQFLRNCIFIDRAEIDTFVTLDVQQPAGMTTVQIFAKAFFYGIICLITPYTLSGMYYAILDKNRQDIESLKKRLANSGLKIQNLEKTIDAMTSEVNSLSYSIDSLNTVIVRKDSMIAMQKSSIETLQEDMTALRSEKQAVDEALARRTDEFYTAWYVFGTSKELKDQGIIARSGAFSQKKVLEGDFNRDYFVKVDCRKISQIPLYAKKAKVLTSHPADSYILEKQGGQYTLRIIDADAFWSVSRYLVVMIN